jgi:multiple sugar transport system permease protein
MQTRDPWRILTLYLPLAGFLVFTLFPIYWTLATSLQDEAAVARLPIRLIPRELTVENYRAL